MPVRKKKGYRLVFCYNNRGYGDLELRNDSLLVGSWRCRTGSIDHQGNLVNAINPDDWFIFNPPVDTEEVGMYIKEGNGWKIRLYLRDGHGKHIFTHYLIHPDGNKPGTKGCIGIQKDDALLLRDRFAQIMKMQNEIPVKVERKNVSTKK